jgi:hypothetical protein
MMYMSFTLSDQNGDEIFHRGTEENPVMHWWLTGFKPGVFTTASDLSMDISITLKNTDMRQAFVNELNNTDTITNIMWTEGSSTVSFTWH